MRRRSRTILSPARCQRLKLDCKIESNFKRVGKRSKNAEMEREIVELRRQLARQQQPPNSSASPSRADPQLPPAIKAPPPGDSASASPTLSQLPSALDQYMGSQEAVASLMDLRSGLEGGSFLRSPSGHILPSRRIEGVVLIYDRVRDLFRQYVCSHHPRPLTPPNWYLVSTLIDENSIKQFLLRLPTLPPPVESFNHSR